MGRGLPAVWSTILSLPFLGTAVWLLMVRSDPIDLPSGALSPHRQRLLGGAMLGFGAFLVIVGIYVQYREPPEPSLRAHERLISTCHPSQRVAISKMVLSLPTLGLAGYLLFFTYHPYIYPIIALLTGLYLLSSGLKRYWINTLTTYSLTNKRIIAEYRFLSLQRSEIPLSKIRGVQERRSAAEALVGLGNIQFASAGGGSSVRVAVRNIMEPQSFANAVRDVMNTL